MMTQDDSEASVFFEFGRQVSVDVSVDHVIKAALDGIMRVMAPDIALFFLRQGEELVVRGVRPEADESADLGSEVKVVGECLCGLAAQGKPVYARDIHADPRCLFSACKKLGARSLAAIPLITREGVSGVVAIASFADREFSGHAAFLEGLAGFVAVALESAMTRQRLEADARRLKIANDALRASEERYRTVAEDMPALVCRFLPDGTLTFVNDRYCAYFDKAREDLLGQDVFLFIPPEERETVRRHYSSLTPERPAVTYEHTVFAPDGTLRWQRWTDRAHHDEHGQPLEYQSMGEDITERKHAEHRIIRLNRLYQVLSSINHAIVRIRDRGELLQEVCRIAVEVGGMRMAWVGVIDDRTGKVTVGAQAGFAGNYLERVDIDMGDQVRSSGPTGSAFRQKQHVICNDIEKDPRMAPWRRDALRLGYHASAAFPLVVEHEVVAVLTIYSGEHAFFDDEEVRLLDGLAMDISFALGFMERERQRVRAEEALRAAEERYRALVEQVPAVSYTARISEASETIYVSPQIERMLGFPMAQWAADPGLWLKQLHPEDRVRVQSECSLTHSEASPFVSEYRMIAADGSTVWIRDEATVVVDESGRSCCLQGVMLDITERKKLEAQLLQAQKMEALGHLAGGIAHDFNNILTAIIGYASLMKLHLPEGDLLQANIEQILTAADKAGALIRSLLAYSRKQLIEPKPVNLNDVVMHLKKLLVRVIGEDIALKTTLAEGDLVVMADRGQLEQIIMNLAANARDAMPDGGHLLIETQEVSLGAEFLRSVGYGKAGRYALLSFADTGTGIDDEALERIFEPFFTTKDPGRGTGLGLAMVYGSVKQHQGIITVESEVGRGTAFKIYLPLSDVGAERSAPEEPARQVSGKEMILVVEDDPVLRTLARDTLSKYGYGVMEAGDGEEAVRMFREHAEAIDLLLLDVIIPKLNGKEVYEAARALKPQVKALFTSGYSKDLMHERGVLREGIHYLHKPFTPNMLLRKLREALESSLTA